MRTPLLSVFLALLAGACTGGDSAPAGRLAAPIIDGERETGYDPVVMIYNESGAGCTATVIAPRVAITAKHCVLGMSPGGWHLMVGADWRSFRDEYGVVETRATPGSAVDLNDFAVMILDRDFEHGFMRWAFAPWPGFRGGSPTLAVGYGQNETGDGGVKMRREGYVSSYGPREFTTLDNNACSGDSGGPLFFEDVLVGVMVRADCAAHTVCTTVDHYADMVLQALRDTGACVPVSFERCNRVDDDCWNGADDGLGEACGCADGGTPGPEVCNRVDDDCNDAVDDLPACGCAGGAAPGTERCNAVDDDCDGAVDEDCLPLGAACTRDDECTGAHCVELGGSPVCAAECGGAAGGVCGDGAFCDRVGCGAGWCRPDAAAGAGREGGACASAADCASRFCADLGAGPVCARSCVPGTAACFVAETCVAAGEGCGGCAEADGAPVPRGFGEPCGADADCLSGSCVTDADPVACADECPARYCGASCGPAGECPPGGHCREGRCVRGRLAEAGEPCVADADCLEGTCVDLGGERRCLAACAPDGGCDPGFSCGGGGCRPLGPRPGDPCTDWCDGSTCVSIPGGGFCAVPCASAGHCPTGLICLPLDGAGWCVPFEALEPAPADGCGCRAAGASPRTGGLLAAAALLLLALRRRRR